MSASQKRTALILFLLGLVYWVIFIPANLQGAQNADMLAIFEVDEYAQYPNVLHMVAPASSLYEGLHNFAVYQHYFYGYPFYFFSGLVLLAGKLLFGPAWLAATPWVVAALRQLINVLPMVLAAGLFTWCVTHFKQRWAAVAVFILILTLPGVVDNNTWWHPDSLGVWLVALVYFFLERDRLRFGLNWKLAAAACGIGLSVKYVGAFFALSIALVLFIAWKQNLLRPVQLLKQAGLFVLIMAAGLLISNPLLLLPQERPEIIRYQILQFSQTNTGIILQQSFAETLAKFWSAIQDSFGGILAVILILTGIVTGLLQFNKRRLTLLILGWSLPYLLVVVNVSNFRPHYLLPLLLPLLALTVYGLTWPPTTPRGRGVSRLVWLAVCAMILLNLTQSIPAYQRQLNKEANSASIQFYERVKTSLLPSLELTSLKVYRDWQVYFPAETNIQVEMNWEKASYALIETLNPDVILLDRREVALYAPEDVTANSVNAGDVAANHAFYADASANRIAGYDLAIQRFVRPGFG